MTMGRAKSVDAFVVEGWSWSAATRAENSCRLLVMDGLPQGTSDYDMYRMNVMANSSVNSLLAQRVEQGIGRG